MRSQNIDLPEEKIVEFCQRNKITEFALFGSVLSNEFRQNSDIDVLITLAPDCGYSLFDLARMQEELKVLLGREIDLVEKTSLQNPFRKHSIINNMEIVYAA